MEPRPYCLYDSVTLREKHMGACHEPQRLHIAGQQSERIVVSDRAVSRTLPRSATRRGDPERA